MKNILVVLLILLVPFIALADSQDSILSHGRLKEGVYRLKYISWGCGTTVRITDDSYDYKFLCDAFKKEFEEDYKYGKLVKAFVSTHRLHIGSLQVQGWDHDLMLYLEGPYKGFMDKEVIQGGKVYNFRTDAEILFNENEAVITRNIIDNSRDERVYHSTINATWEKIDP